MAKFLKNVPITEEWNRMKLHENVESTIKEQYQVVYKKSTENGKWCLYNLYNNDISYNDDYVITTVGSVCHGICLVDKGTPFVNVVGSTGDPRPEGVSWIGLMRIVYDALGKDKRLLESCCTDGNYYIPYNTPNGIMWNTRENICGTGIVGGHILPNQTVSVECKEGSTVLMLPICISHNSSMYHGAGYFMCTKWNIWALVLDQYLQSEKIQRYLDNNDFNN